jgi:hypothetical protein
MPSRRFHRLEETAAHLHVSETAAAGLTLALASALSLVLLGSYTTYQSTPFVLTLEQPFTAWRDVRSLYQGLSGQPVISPPDNLTALVMATAWCNYTTPRPYVVPANRSAACACLWGKQQTFAYNNTWGGGLYNQSTCYAAGDAAVGCLRYRSVWNVWQCGGDCAVHPMVLALTGDLGLVALALAALLGSLRQPRWAVWALTALPVLAGLVLLLYARPVQNFFFVMVLLAVWAGIVVGLDGELSGRERPLPIGEGGPALVPPRPLPLVTCFWFAQPLLTASAAVYLAVAHTVRDLLGVLAYAGLGYLAGLLAQRLHWCRCYLVFGADGGGWPLPRHFAFAVQRLAVDCLSLALVGVWTGLLVLAYTQWLGSSPYAAAAVSLVLLLLFLAVGGLEIAAAMLGPALGSEIGRLGWLEGAQISLALAAQVIFTVTSVVDGAR